MSFQNPCLVIHDESHRQIVILVGAPLRRTRLHTLPPPRTSPSLVEYGPLHFSLPLNVMASGENQFLDPVHYHLDAFLVLAMSRHGCVDQRRCTRCRPRRRRGNARRGTRRFGAIRSRSIRRRPLYRDLRNGSGRHWRPRRSQHSLPISTRLVSNDPQNVRLDRTSIHPKTTPWS